MIRTAVATALLVLAVAPVGSAIAQDQACKSHTAQACYIVHGGLLTANGTPSVRIAVGDGRVVLGVAGGEEPPLPDAVRKGLVADMFSNRLLGDYVVCPQTEGNQGQMQMVCVRSASNLKLEPR